MNGNVKKAKRKSSDKIKRNKDEKKYEKQRLRKNLKSDIKKKVNRKKDIIFNIGSKGFTLVELIATIAIIAIISTITIISVTSLINSTREKSLQTAYSSLKETAATLSKELPEDYWDIDKENNYYVSCVSVKDMKNEGYYKEDDFNNDFSRKGKIDDETFVIVKKDMDSKVIISSEIDDKGYCSNGSFNNANLKVKSYTPSTISVEADCGSDAGYIYKYFVVSGNSVKQYGTDKEGKVFTYTGLSPNTNYKLKVTCSKDNNSASKTGYVEQKTGKNNTITLKDECTSQAVPITINYNDGGEYFFKLTSSGSVDSKYKARECTKTDSSSCNSEIITNVKANTWYNVSSKSIIVNINNNGTIYVYSSGNNDDVKFSSSLTNAVTLIDKSVPNVPTLSISDKIESGKWHKNNYTINLSKSENSKANPKCKTVTYEYSIDNSNFNTISGTSKSMSTEEKANTYYFRAKSKNGNVSDSVNYVSSLDKTKPVCTFYDIKDFRKTNTKDITFTCTDTMSGIVSKNLSSSDFNLKNISIVNISSPEKISNGYKYTINIKADTIGNDSYIGIKSNIIYDNAGNGNSAKNSNTFKVLPNTYTVTYNSNGCGNNCNPKTKTVTYGEKYGELCTLSKTGYNFSGWYTATSGGTKITSSSTYNIEGDQTLYARCSAKSYTIKYNANGGTGNMNDMTVTYDKNAAIGSNAFSRTGYTFAGWTTNSNGTNDGYNWTNWSGTWVYDNGQYGINNNTLNLYARWSAKTYTIKYNANGGTGSMSDATATYGKTATISSNGFSRTGYTFVGWTTNSNGTNDGYNWTNWSGTWVYDNGQYGINNNTLNLYARWSAKTYTIKYNANGGTGSMSDTTATYGKTATISSNGFSRTGYTFAGWTTNSNGTNDGYNWTNWSGTWVYDNGQYGISNNILKLYARWNENLQTINGYRCSGSDLYYITTCGLGTGICNYTYKNDFETTGTVVRSNLNNSLSKCSNYQVNNDVKYTQTLKMALELVSSSNTIKILNDNTDKSSATVSKNVTIDTNGKTVTRTSTINVNSGYTLTMNGTGGILNTSSRVFSVSGTLKIQGGTYENKSNTNSDAIYLGSSGNIVLNDVNEINIWSDYGCGSAIMSDSSNSINVNATSAGIKLYGYCYGIWAKDATVNVTSSYNDSIYGVTNWIEAIKGYAIRAKNINFGSSNVYQNGSNYFNPGARSQSYTTNTSTFNVLYADGSINYKSGTLYSTYSYGKFQKDCYTSASCRNFGSTYTYKPYYTGISDTIGSVKGSIFTNVTPNISWGYGQYFTSSYDTLALRIVKTK